MTLQELYTEMGGNYDQAVRVMKMDKLIDRYVRRLKDSRLDEGLNEAMETMDPVKLFENTHAMKGVCANLGLDALAAAAAEITEEFRPGGSRRLSDETVKAKLRETIVMYQNAVDCIDRYIAG